VGRNQIKQVSLFQIVYWPTFDLHLIPLVPWFPPTPCQPFCNHGHGQHGMAMLMPAINGMAPANPSPLLSSLANHALLLPLALLNALVLAVGRREHDTGQINTCSRRPEHADDGMGAAHGHAQGTRCPDAPDFPRTTSSALRLARAPQTR
jgi:hypothetical protein